MRVTLKEDYDKEFDILNFYFGDKKVKHSREISVKMVVDFDGKDNIVGLEIFDFSDVLRRNQKELDKIFEKHNKKK